MAILLVCNLEDILKQNKISNGVVHSFSCDLKELQELLAMGFYIGVNGCSLKTKYNIDVIKNVPLDRLMVETDCPYCDIKKSHYSYKYVKTFFPMKTIDKFDEAFTVKGRNEPCFIK